MKTKTREHSTAPMPAQKHLGKRRHRPRTARARLPDPKVIIGSTGNPEIDREFIEWNEAERRKHPPTPPISRGRSLAERRKIARGLAGCFADDPQAIRELEEIY